MAWLQLGNDIDGADGDESGKAVSLSSDGTVVAIGAHKNDDHRDDAGTTRIYAWDGSAWVQRGTAINGARADDGSGYSVSLSSDGTVVAIGSPGNDWIAENSGHTRIYDWDGSAWVRRGRPIFGTQRYTSTGEHVSLSSDGNVVAIGATRANGNGTYSGHARIWAWDGSAWIQRGGSIYGESAGDYSGVVSLSSDGTTIAIGGHGANPPGAWASGHTRIFDWSGTAWVQRGDPIKALPGDRSGSSVSLASDGNTVAIHASGNDNNGLQSGTTRIFEWDSSSSSWNQLGTNIDGEAKWDAYLTSPVVTLSGDGKTVAVGAAWNDGNGTSSGHTRIYQWDGSAWNQVGSDIDGEAAYDFSGTSVSLSNDGSTVAIGATDNDGGGHLSGHVRVFSLDNTPPTIAVSSDVSSLKGGETATLSFTLSESSTDFTVDDISVSGGSLSNFSGSGSSYSATFTPTEDSTTNGVISVASSTFSDSAGNSNNDGSDSNNSVTLSVDSVRPTVAVNSDVSSLIAGETATLTFTLSESSSDFTEADLNISGGTVSNFSGSGTSYSATFTPTADSTTDGVISVASGVFSNASGNSNDDGSDSNNSVTLSVDSVRPTIAISSDISSLSAGETATLTFTLAEASTDFAEADVSITGGSLSNFSGSGSSYSATFTPDTSSDTNEVISIASGVFSDAAGNTNADGSDSNNSVTLIVDTVSAPPFTRLGNDIDGEAKDDQSGAVALSSDGTILAIGAQFNDGGGNRRGRTRIYAWNSGASRWDQRGNDINGESNTDYSGSAVSISDDGSVVAIGAISNDGGGNGNESGHTRIFAWDGSDWVQRGSDLDGEASNDNSGGAVSLSSDGSVVAIGAKRNNNASGENAGQTRVYAWNGTAWVQRGSDIDGETAQDLSGCAVSLSGDGNTLAIGAQQNRGRGGKKSGHTRVYDWDGSTWVQRGSDINGESRGDQSGLSVSLSTDGNVVAIGGKFNDGNGSDSGHTRIYDWDGTAWVKRGDDIDGESAGDRSGGKVSLSGDGNVVAIGAPQNTANGTKSGHTRIYQWDGTAWNHIGSDIDGEAADDYSGGKISLSRDGSTVAIGSLFNDDNGSNAGHVRVFQLPDLTAPTIAITDDDADNSLSAGDTATLTFTLSEASTNFVESDVDVSGGSLSNWLADSSTTYSVVFTPAENSNADGVISVASSKFSDSAGNNNIDGADANNSVTFTVDTTSPSPSPTPSPSPDPSPSPSPDPSPSPSPDPSPSPSSDPSPSPSPDPSPSPSPDPSPSPSPDPSPSPSSDPSPSPSPDPSPSPSSDPSPEDIGATETLQNANTEPSTNKTTSTNKNTAANTRELLTSTDLITGNTNYLAPPIKSDKIDYTDTFLPTSEPTKDLVIGLPDNTNTNYAQKNNFEAITTNSVDSDTIEPDKGVKLIDLEKHSGTIRIKAPEQPIQARIGILLTKQPNSIVTVTVRAAEASGTAIFKSKINFTPENWDTPQEIKFNSCMQFNTLLTIQAQANKGGGFTGTEKDELTITTSRQEICSDKAIAPPKTRENQPQEQNTNSLHSNSNFTELSSPFFIIINALLQPIFLIIGIAKTITKTTSPRPNNQEAKSEYTPENNNDIGFPSATFIPNETLTTIPAPTAGGEPSANFWANEINLLTPISANPY